MQIPAKNLDKAPKHNWAIYSQLDGTNSIELESSAADKEEAYRFLACYRNWGLTDTTFYLVDWKKKTAIAKAKFPAPIQLEEVQS